MFTRLDTQIQSSNKSTLNSTLWSEEHLLIDGIFEAGYQESDTAIYDDEHNNANVSGVDESSSAGDCYGHSW